jgi:hypothetical protein
MGPHMKTTIEIADSLFHEVKALARRDGVTVRALVERGLQGVVAERRVPRSFRLRDLSYAGQGLEPTAADRSWEELRAMTYAGRGD